MSSEGKSIVPNFVGRTLPRRDKGNREEYCLTMLCFFKPWHTGKDLKNTGESWDDAFLQYSFSEHQIQLMNNFQIKYECNDARDDFSAQERQDTKFTGFSALSENMNDLDNQHAEDNNTAEWDVGHFVDSLETMWDNIGKQTLNKLSQMSEIDSVLCNAGWLDSCESNNYQNMYQDVSDPFNSSIHQSVQWKFILSQKRNDIIQKSMAINMECHMEYHPTHM